MFLQVDTSFTFCLAAIKNPVVMLQPSTPAPPAALLTGSRPVALHPPSVILGNGQRLSPSALFPLKSPCRKKQKLVNSSSSHSAFTTPPSSCPDVLQSHLPAWGTCLTPSCCPTTPGAPLSFRPRAAACALCAFSEIFEDTWRLPSVFT